MSEELHSDEPGDSSGTSSSIHVAASKQPPNRAVAVSLLVHALVIAILIVGLPHLRSYNFGEPTKQKAISVTLVETKETDPVVLSQAAAQQPVPVAPQPAQESQVGPPPAQPQQQVQDTSSDALPFDPSFNPFATAQPSQAEQSADASQSITQSSSPGTQPSPVAQAQPGPPDPVPDDGIKESAVGPNLGGMGPTGSGSMRDGRRHPQYLELQLGGFVRSSDSGDLHEFLLRLISCGVVPISSPNPNLSVEANVTFSPQGTLLTAQLTNQSEFGADPGYQKASRKLLNALANPVCAHIHLPVQYYPAWRAVHISFFQRLPMQ